MSDPTDERPTLSGVATLIIEAGLASLYLGALVFLAGWSYAERYFAALGLNLSAIDGLDASAFSGYALWVLRDGALTLLAAGVAILLGLFVARRGLGWRNNTWLAVLISVLALASLVGAAKLGSMRAATQVPKLFVEGYSNFVRVRVVARKDSELSQVFSDRGDLGESTCLRKVFMDQRNLYAYAGYESTRGPLQPIMIIPLADVALIETVTNTGLCRP